MPDLPSDIWKDDTLGRVAFSNQLTRIAETSEAPSVVLVTATFGMGKTYFAQRWVRHLQTEGKLALYFNAWETDYALNPLIAFLDALKEAITSMGIQTRRAQPVRKQLKAVARVGAKIAAKAAIRAATFGVVGEKIETQVEAAISGGLDQIEKLVETRLETFAKEKAERRKFKEELSHYRAALLKAVDLQVDFSPVNRDESRPRDAKLYVVIDELDRCRAPYALTLLEDMKHLFDAEGFVFILFADEDALQSAASRILGFESKGEGYLRKFVDLRLHLPDPDREKFAKWAMSGACRGMTWQRNNFWPSFCKQFGDLVSRTSLTLRQIMLTMRQFDVVARSQERKRLELAPALAIGIVLREVNFSTYRRLGSDMVTFVELTRLLRIDAVADEFFAAWALIMSSDRDAPTQDPNISARAAKILDNLPFDFGIHDGASVPKLVFEYIESADRIMP